MVPFLFITIVTLVFLLACCLSDVWYREIPNSLSGGGILVGLILNAALLGRWGIAGSLLGLTLCIGTLLAPFAFGGIGGGDLKMMGAVGALLGPRLGLHALAAGTILGGVVMCLHLARIGRLREKLASTLSIAHRAVSNRSLASLHISDDDAAAITLPYSIPLAIGTTFSLMLGWTQGPF